MHMLLVEGMKKVVSGTSSVTSGLTNLLQFMLLCDIGQRKTNLTGPLIGCDTNLMGSLIGCDICICESA